MQLVDLIYLFKSVTNSLLGYYRVDSESSHLLEISSNYVRPPGVLEFFKEKIPGIF